MPPVLSYQAFEDKEVPGEWRVEAVNRQTGEAFIAIFTGPQCQARAAEYASFKNQLLSGAVPAPSPTPAPRPPQKALSGEILTLSVQDGQVVELHMPVIRWTWNERMKSVTGRQIKLKAMKG